MVITSCVGDMATTPESSCYSEKNNLLIERYTYPKDTLKIVDDYYIITDVWVSHNFKKRSSDEINKNYVWFFCTFKNIKTGEYFLNNSKESPIYSFTNSVTGGSHGFSGLGGKFENYTFSFKEKNSKLLPDTITITIINAYDKTKEKSIQFFKYSSLYNFN